MSLSIQTPYVFKSFESQSIDSVYEPESAGQKRSADDLNDRLVELIILISSLMAEHLELSSQENIDHNREQLKRNLSTYNPLSKISLTALSIAAQATGILGQALPSVLPSAAQFLSERVLPFNIHDMLFSRFEGKDKEIAKFLGKAFDGAHAILQQVHGVNDNSHGSERAESESHKRIAESDAERANRKQQENLNHIQTALQQFAEANRAQKEAKQSIMSR